jgi:hypothetical protein
MKMRKSFLSLVLVTSLGVLVQLSCGGSSMQSTNANPNFTPASGSMAVFGGDAPLCSVLSFEVTITGITLTPQSGGTTVSALGSNDSITVDFAALRGFNTLLNLSSVPAGTYNQVTLTLSNPVITYLDTTQNPPAPTTLNGTLTSATVTVDINPALTLTANGTAGLNLDFRLRKSLQVDNNGQITGTVDPVFKATPSVISTLKGVGELDDFHGLVQSVNTTSTNSSFTGSFTVQRPSGRTFLINVTSKTDYDDVSGLSGLSQGMYVEVDAYVDASGNIVATEVEAEEKPDVSIRRAAFVGTIIDVIRDPAGNATQFKLFVGEEHPDVSSSVPRHTSLMVTIDQNTRFHIGRMAWREDHDSRLEFNAKSLGLAQEVTVIGRFDPSSPPSALARLILLRPHGYACNFSTLLAAGSDGKTGGFTMIPCSPVLRGQPITAVTFSTTAFSGGLTDLTSLKTSQDLVVGGLLFYQQTDIEINGVKVTAPAYVLEAKRVHELD